MVSETLTFIILGASMYSMVKVIKQKPMLMIMSIFIVFISRFLSIIPCCYLANIKRKNKITNKMMFTMAYAGPRGTMSYALAVQAMSLILDSSQGYLIVAMTASYVFFSTYIVGTSLGPMCKYLNLSGSKTDTPSTSISIFKLIY